MVERVESSSEWMLRRRQQQRQPGAVNVRVLQVRSELVCRRSVARHHRGAVLERTVYLELDRGSEQRRRTGRWTVALLRRTTN